MEEKAYGEGFRQGVSRVLEEVDKLGFVPKEVREALTANAAKLCLVEAIAEKQAEEIAERAKKEWQAQAPELLASAKRLKKDGEVFAATVAREASAVLKRLFPDVPPEA